MGLLSSFGIRAVADIGLAWIPSSRAEVGDDPGIMFPCVAAAPLIAGRERADEGDSKFGR
jgi:hypothetical protein